MGRFIPPLTETSQTSTWTGVRATGEDNVPQLCERAPGLWFVGALAGRGFLASASLARSLAETLAARQL